MSASEPGRQLVGKTLNHYEILSEIGRGGMGEVYLARDTRLDRRVALKVLPEDLAGSADRRARFDREARAIAALKHPNIVTIYSVEKSNGTDFITMELIEGKSFSEIIPKKGFPLQQLLDRAISLSDALGSAHKNGITHRDIKPDNIMLDAEGRLKILDFGLAKLRDKGDPGVPGTQELTAVVTSSPTASNDVTQEGKILGTVAYMSPEQAEGKVVDSRTDIFSLGVVLYEMATGQRPFKGDTHISMITSIIRDEPVTVSEMNGSLPRHLGRIVKRCLAKKPDRRYQTAVDLRNDLEELKEEMETGELRVPAGIVPVRRGSVLKWGAVAVAGIALFGAAYILQNTLRRDTAVPAGPRQGMEITRLTSNGESREATISPDGRYVAHLLNEDGGRQRSLWVTQVATGSQVQIVAPSVNNIYDPAFSPDGDFVYFIMNERGSTEPDLFRVPTLGGTPRKILDHANGRISFAPDGGRIVFLRGMPGTQETRIVVAGIDGRGVQVLAKNTFPRFFDDPVWSPDGKTVAVAQFTISEGIHSNVVALPATGGNPQVVGDRSWKTMGEMSWLPDGSGLVFTAGERLVNSDQIWELSYPGGVARRVTNDMNTYHGAVLTADGSALVTQVAESTFHLWVTEPGEGAVPIQVTRGVRNFDGFGLAWTPDGQIVYGAGDQGRLVIRRIGADGTGLQEVVSAGSIAAAPVVSPDGETLVFMSDQAGNLNLWRSDLDGSNLIQLTKGDFEADPSFTPDGKWIYYQGGQDQALYKIALDGGEPVQVSDRKINSPRISPDGTRIALRAWHEEEEKFLIDILPIEGGDPVQTFDIEDAGEFHWARDGQALTYGTTTGGAENIWSQPLDGGPPVQLTHFDSEGIQGFAWSPDGKRIAVSRGRTDTDIVLLRNFR